MSQTLFTTRSLRSKYHGHWHKLHLVVLEDCDADDQGGECDAVLDAELIEGMWEAVKKILEFKEEPRQ